MNLDEFDLASQGEAGYTFTLRHPITNKELDAKITVKGAESPTFKNATNAAVERGRAWIKANHGKDRPQAELDSEGSDILAAVTVGWENIDANGKPLEFSKDAAKELYLKFDWIAEQVRTAVYTRSNFFLMREKD